MSHQHFWQCLYDLKPLCISHVQRLVQQAISVRFPNSKSPLEIHQFMNKTLIRSLLRSLPFNSTKVATCPSEGMKLCTSLPQCPFTRLCFAETGEKKCPPLRYDPISAVVVVALWHYLLDACLETQHNPANLGFTVITCTSYRYSYISIYLPN